MTNHRRSVVAVLLVLSLVSSSVLFLSSPASAAEFTEDRFTSETIALNGDQAFDNGADMHFVTNDTWVTCWQQPSTSFVVTRTTDRMLSQSNTTITDSQQHFEEKPCSIDSSGDTVVMAWMFAYSADDSRLAISTSTDAGSTWTNDLDPLGNGTTTESSGTGPSLTVLDEDSWRVFYTEFANSGKFIHLAETDDAGSTWVHTNLTQTTPASTHTGATFAADGDAFSQTRMAVAVRNGSLVDVLATSDGGSTWTLNDTGTSGESQNMHLAYQGAEDLFLRLGDGSTSKVYRSTDGASSWTSLGSLEIGSSNRGNEAMCLGETPGTVYHTASEGFSTFTLKQSTDNGSSATTVTLTRGATATNPNFANVQGCHANADGMAVPTWRKTNDSPDRGIFDVTTNLQPQEPTINSASLFGNAQDVGVLWDGTPFIYVKDIATADRIYKINTGLSIVSNRDVCGGASVTQGNDVWFNEGSSDTFTIEDGKTILGLSVNRNASAPILHDCEVSGLFDGATVARTDTMAYVDIIPYASGSFTDQLYMQASDAFDARNAIYADISGAKTTTGLYLMTSGFSDFFHSSELGPNPFENLTDVAVDKEVGLNTRTFCVTSSSNGTRCYNQNGGLRAANTTLDAELIEVFNNEILTHNSTETAKWIIQESDFVKQATIASTDNFAEWQVSRDGRYLHAVGTTSSADYVLYDVANWTEISRLSSPFLDTPRSVSSDASNNHAYVVDQTTIYQIEVFNFTTSDEGAGVIGEPNPTTDLDSDEEPTDGTTQDEEGKVASLANSLNIPTFAMELIFASVLLFFGAALGGLFIGSKPGAWIGAGAGFLLGVGFQLYDTWVLVTLVIIAAAVIAKEGF